MQNEVHQHPDGLIFVRSSDGGVYFDTLDHFQTDYGVTLPPLSEGADERIYAQGVRHAIIGGGSVLDGGDMPWVLGDQIIANVASGILAKKARDDAAAQSQRDQDEQASRDANEKIRQELLLRDTLNEVCPIESVNVGHPTDRTQWTFIAKPEATQAEIDAANALLQTVSMTPVVEIAVSDWIGRFTNAEYRAAIAQTWRQTGGNAKTWDIVVSQRAINPARKKVQALKTSLVADGILTQARANEIFG
jgi:hypothetical protein